MFLLIERFRQDESGATAVEYAIIAGGIFVAITAVITNLGSEVAGMYTAVATQLAAMN
jgi:pilus assembly protein Flp/PilA